MPTDTTAAPPSVAALAANLTAALGPSRVSTDPGELDAMSHDAWPVSVVQAKRGAHVHRPEVVVRVDEESQVATTLTVAAAHGAAVTPRGLGSSVTGQPLPVHGGVLLDLGGLVGPAELDEMNLTVRVPAGVRGSDLESWLGERGYTMNFFPQSLSRSSVGGWLATRATGQFSSRYGGVEDLAVSYVVILADGTAVSVGSRPRAAVGPDLRELFLGSEGAFGVIVSVTLKVFRLAEHRVLAAYLMPDVESGLAAMRTIVQSGLRPALVRFYDEDETRHAVPGEGLGGCALFLACEGLDPVATSEAEACADIVTALRGRGLGPDPVSAWLSRRFDFSTVENVLAVPGGYAETIEVAHFWSDVAGLHRELRRALAPLADEVLGHFSHVYPQGTSLYVILLGRAEDDDEAQQRLAEIWRTAMEVTVRCGGELSHHHGAGLARQEYIAASLGAQHGLLRRLKDALDPKGLLNPGKLGL